MDHPFKEERVRRESIGHDAVGKKAGTLPVVPDKVYRAIRDLLIWVHGGLLFSVAIDRACSAVHTRAAVGGGSKNAGWNGAGTWYFPRSLSRTCSRPPSPRCV